MIQKFRILSILEGVSFLIILFITMPLKYLLSMGMPNKIIGTAHGILFIAYIVFAIFLKVEKNWDLKKTAIILACSVIPFGTFWMEKKYLRTEN